jgi:quercetin dioxygenase-like cupin family protein
LIGPFPDAGFAAVAPKERPVRRSYLPLASALSALTAIALIAAALAIRPPGVPAASDGPLEARNLALVHRFYAAANLVIAEGDLEPLAAVAAPALVAVPAGADPGRANLARRLLALHATVPTLRLAVEAVAVDGDQALVRVGTETARVSAFLGLGVVEQPDLWGPVDVLRIDAGRVVELEDGGRDAGLLEPALAAPFDAPFGARRLVLQRVALAPGAGYLAGAVDGPRLLILEAGTVAVEARPSATYAAPGMTLSTGQYLALRPNAGHEVRNNGEGPATLLDVYAFGPQNALRPDGPAASTPDQGVAVQILAGGLTTELPGGRVVLAVGRATLPPGARLTWAEAAGPVLLHVEAGAAILDPGGGVAWTLDASGRLVTLGDDPLAAGDGALVVAGNAVALRAAADAPATLLVVTLLPAGGPEPTVDQATGTPVPCGAPVRQDAWECR